MVRHQPSFYEGAPCCPTGAAGRIARSNTVAVLDPVVRRGSLVVICAPSGATGPLSVGAFGDWLARTFTDGEVTWHGTATPHALEWMRHDCRSRSRLDGWLSRDRKVLCLFGDADLAHETAEAIRGLLDPGSFVVSKAWDGAMPIVDMRVD